MIRGTDIYILLIVFCFWYFSKEDKNLMTPVSEMGLLMLCCESFCTVHSLGSVYTVKDHRPDGYNFSCSHIEMISMLMLNPE